MLIQLHKGLFGNQPLRLSMILPEDYQHHPIRGDFTIYGGLIAERAIHIADYSGGVVVSGYYRDYHYDGRMITLPPPFFPFSSNFGLVTWEEVVPVEVVGG